MGHHKEKKFPDIGDLVISYILNTDLDGPQVLDIGLVISTKLPDQILVHSCRENQKYWWNNRRWKILSHSQKRAKI